MVKVWSVAVRLLHWALVATVAAAWFSTAGWGATWHQRAGWAALGVVALRVAAGLGRARAAPAGRPAGFAHFTRFARFVRSPGATFIYAAALVRGREPRHLGHNPLGGWMVLALLTCVAALGLTGWLYTTDLLWGDETVERLHTALAWLLLALAALHVCGVVVTSLRHRENLVRAMFSGFKRAPGPGDVV